MIKKQKLRSFSFCHLSYAIICALQWLCPFLYVPKHKKKRNKFLAFTFFFLPQTSGYSGISMSRNYSEASVTLLYSSYILCLFLHQLFLLTLVKSGSARAAGPMIVEISHPLFFPHWYHLPTSNHIYVLEIFWALLFSNPRLWNHAYFWLEHFGKNSS